MAPPRFDLCRRAGQPGEVVRAALHLASDASTCTTRAACEIDGGPACAPA
jgi:NAD(P)-dependent dehydrogenase (short-subunit alcohol dehydrogenase family)